MGARAAKPAGAGETAPAFPAATAFIDRTELLLSSLGLGTHFAVKEAADGAPRHLKLDHAFPVTALARSLAVDTQAQGLADALLARWAAARPDLPAVRGPRLAADATVSAQAQGLYMCARGRDGALALERGLCWEGDRPYMARSISKSWAAGVLLALQDAGLLRIDDPVSRFLPEYGEGELGAVTLRMLLTHTAGFQPFMALPGDASPPALTDPSITLREAAAQIAGLPRVAPPGAEFHYTELGYQVAGAAAEVAGGGSWYELFERYLGGPLELAGTRWFNTYSTDPQPPNPLIAVGSVTCANDLSKFAAMVLAGGEHARGDGAVLRVLSAAAVADLARYQDIGDTSKDKVFGVHRMMQERAKPLVEAGLITEEELHAVGEAWSNVGYGLGCWLGTHPETGARNVFFRGAYTGAVSLMGVGSASPLAVILLTYSMDNPLFAVLAGLAARDWAAPAEAAEA